MSNSRKPWLIKALSTITETTLKLAAIAATVFAAKGAAGQDSNQGVTFNGTHVNLFGNTTTTLTQGQNTVTFGDNSIDTIGPGPIVFNLDPQVSIADIDSQSGSFSQSGQTVTLSGDAHLTLTTTPTQTNSPINPINLVNGLNNNLISNSSSTWETIDINQGPIPNPVVYPIGAPVQPVSPPDDGGPVITTTTTPLPNTSTPAPSSSSTSVSSSSSSVSSTAAVAAMMRSSSSAAASTAQSSTGSSIDHGVAGIPDGIPSSTANIDHGAPGIPDWVRDSSSTGSFEPESTHSSGSSEATKILAGTAGVLGGLGVLGLILRKNGNNQVGQGEAPGAAQGVELREVQVNIDNNNPPAGPRNA